MPGFIAQTLILGFGMLALCGVPVFIPSFSRHSRLFSLVGTGAMLGICLFDLMPDVFELGGQWSLVVMGVVWLLYSVSHLLHLGHHHAHAAEGQEHPVHAFGLFFGSMVAHCFASGMLLAVSQGISEKLATSIFIALVVHKAYESVTVSSILLQGGRGRLWNRLAILGYAASLPLGVLATLPFRAGMSKGVAVIISSIAVGTLLGCLFFDFLLPSLRHLRARRRELAWMVMGMLLTRFVMGLV